MLRGEHIRSKVHASGFGVLKNQQPAVFGLENLKTKTRYADVFTFPKQKMSYREGIWWLKSKKPITSHNIQF